MLATLRPARAGPQLAALHPRGDRGAQARVRRSRALLRRLPARVPARRAAVAGLSAGARRAHPPSIARRPRRRRPAIRTGAALPGGAPARPARAASRRGRRAADGTTHIAAIDRDGNMICLTPSGGVFRKSAFAPELGCTLSTRSEMFVLEDGHPNALAPGKRPRTTLVSYLICEDGVPDHDRRLPGRRRPGPGRSAARAERAGLRHEPAAGGRGAALLDPDAGELVLPARLPARPAQRGAGHPASARAPSCAPSVTR